MTRYYKLAVINFKISAICIGIISTLLFVVTLVNLAIGRSDELGSAMALFSFGIMVLSVIVYLVARFAEREFASSNKNGTNG